MVSSGGANSRLMESPSSRERKYWSVDRLDRSTNHVYVYSMCGIACKREGDVKRRCRSEKKSRNSRSVSRSEDPVFGRVATKRVRGNKKNKKRKRKRVVFDC